MGRLTLFWLVLVAAVLGFAAWNYLGQMPITVSECDPADIPGSQALHTQAFGEWVLWRTLTVAGFGVVLTYLTFYLQLFHGWRAGTPLRLLTCLAVAFALGVVHLRRATVWASEQVGTCLSQALDNYFAVQHVALTDALLPSSFGWVWAMYMDLTLSISLSLVVGFGTYLLLRGSMRV